MVNLRARLAADEIMMGFLTQAERRLFDSLEIAWMRTPLLAAAFARRWDEATPWLDGFVWPGDFRVKFTPAEIRAYTRLIGPANDGDRM